MSANSLPKVYVTVGQIQDQLDAVSKMVEDAVYMTDTQADIYVLGVTLLVKTKQVLLPIIGVKGLETMFAQYIQNLRDKENGSQQETD